ncbi:MAG: alpha/beta hydrolase, partial [Acidobacteriota bacterium]|nr:alpha/beta hydrolase [Acidobacteriota bacterium]
VSNIHNPSLLVYLPPKDKATGAAMIIAPGGGHRFLSIDTEGTNVAEWLNSIGVAAFVLKYRLAREEGSPYKVDVDALADAQRAIRMVRARNPEWNVNPSKIGIMGFSAGGEIAALASTHYDSGKPGAADAVDKQNSRPDYQILIYPGLRPDSINVTKDTPPTFM